MPAESSKCPDFGNTWIADTLLWPVLCKQERERERDWQNTKAEKHACSKKMVSEFPQVHMITGWP